MAYAYKIAELRATSDDELIDRHDREAPTATAEVNYYLSELDRRENRRRTATIGRRTWAIAAMTAVDHPSDDRQLGPVRRSHLMPKTPAGW